MSIRLKLFIIFLSIALIPLLFVSTLNFHNYKNSLEIARFLQLEDLAAFKKERIEAYFNGLKADVAMAQGFYNIKKNLPILSQFAQDTANPEFVAAKETLDGQLQRMQSTLSLFDIMLINTQGRIVYASKPEHYPVHFLNLLADPGQKAFEKGKTGVYFSDIFLDKTDNKLTMLVTGPIFDFTDNFIGVIAFEVDMAPIYSIIQDVVGLGVSGEVLIGKKKDNVVVFLNPLRHDPQAALNRKIPRGGKFGEPIQEAAQGKNGFGRLIDYRGEEVVAAWKYIPALDWGLVAKIDAQEAFADVTNLRNLVIIILIIVLVLAGIMSLSIAQSIAEPIKKLSKGAEEIGAGNLDYKVGTEQKDEIGQLSRRFDKMAADLKNITASRDELNKESIERKRAEEQLQRINRTLQARSHIDRLAIISENEVDFLKAACQIIVADCGYPLVWIGFAEDDKLKTVWPVASAGFEEGYLENLEVSWADNERGQGPTGTAIRSAKPCACTNMLTDPRFKPWRQEALKRGYASSFVIPLLDKGQAFGAVSIYSKQPGSLTDEEIKLLVELVDDLAHGIFMIRLRQAHLRTIGALRESEERYKRIVFTSPEAIFVQSSGRIRFVNPEAVEMFKASDQSDLINRPVLSVVPREFHELAKQAIRGTPDAQPAEVEIKLVRLNGEIFDGSITGRSIAYAGKPAVQMIIRDVTGIKKAQEILKRDKEVLEKLVDEKAQELLVAHGKIEEAKRLADIGTLSATVAHELRNPLAAMRMAAYNIRRKAQNPELEKNLDNIEIKIKDSEQIINDLLFYSRLKLPKLEEVNIFDILKENIANLESRYSKHNIKIKQDFDGLRGILIEADPLQMGELFGNILNNAFEAVDLESADAEIEVIGIADAHYVKLAIQDNGIGINPADAKKIFEPFFSTKAKGTGLGLAVCNQIVSLHNGSIEIKNRQDKGAVVSIVLPLKREKNG